MCSNAEERQLVSLVRTVEGVEHRGSSPSKAIDWNRFLNFADFHGVSGIVWNAIRDNPSVAYVPSWVKERLRELYYGTCAVNTLAIDSLRKLSKELATQGIPFLVVKGATLLGEIYEDIGTRPLNDIDVLIEPENLQTVDAVLKENGFENTEYSPREYVKGLVVVELHTKLVDLITPVRLSEEYVPTSLTDKKIWQESQTTDVLGFPLRTFSEDHTLVLTVLHTAYKHEFERLIWCVDLVRLVKRQVAKGGWQDLVRIAQETGVSCLMSDALLYSELSLGLRVPKSVYQNLLKQGKPILQRTLLLALQDGTLSGLARHVYSLLRTRGLQGKAHFLLRAITPSKRILSLQSTAGKPGLCAYLRHSYRLIEETVRLGAHLFGIGS